MRFMKLVGRRLVAPGVTSAGDMVEDEQGQARSARSFPPEDEPGDDDPKRAKPHHGGSPTLRLRGVRAVPDGRHHLKGEEERARHRPMLGTDLRRSLLALSS